MKDIDYQHKISDALNTHLVKSGKYYPEGAIDRVSCYNTTLPEEKYIYIEASNGYFWKVLHQTGYPLLTQNINEILHKERIPYNTTLYRVGQSGEMLIVYYAEYHPFVDVQDSNTRDVLLKL